MIRCRACDHEIKDNQSRVMGFWPTTLHRTCAVSPDEAVTIRLSQDQFDTLKMSVLSSLNRIVDAQIEVGLGAEWDRLQITFEKMGVLNHIMYETAIALKGQHE